MKETNNVTNGTPHRGAGGLIMSIALLAAAFTMTMASCSDDDDKGGNVSQSEKEEAMEDITKAYLGNVVYPTYGQLATECNTLFDRISKLKSKLKNGQIVDQSEIDAICQSYKDARRYWEESEAFLYGAASDFEIDPHIDTWPLDVATLASDLSDDSKIARLDAADGIDYARTYLTKENLGFHGLEFIFFRDGQNRRAEFFNNNSTESYKDYFNKVSVTSLEEVIFATAVAGDLRDKCFQLEVAWNKDAEPAHVERVKVCAQKFDDFGTTTKNGVSYGEDLLLAGTSQSAHNSRRKVIETILVSGCSNICAEVADQKMGQAYRSATGAGTDDDDPNYIESPYSYNSFTDFYDNIVSIQNALYGNYNSMSYNEASVMAYLKAYNPEEASQLQQRLTEALASLNACKLSGTPFVLNPGSPLVKTAMEAVSKLDSELNIASSWILRN